jgi:hypothetical protein
MHGLMSIKLKLKLNFNCMVPLPKIDYIIIEKMVILLQGPYLEHIFNTVGPRLEHGPTYCDV